MHLLKPTALHSQRTACLYIAMSLSKQYFVFIPAASLAFNARTSDGLTPLLVAAKYNRKNSVLWLLQDGIREDGTCLVDITAKDDKGRNAIHLAVLDMKCGYTIEVGTCMCMTSTMLQSL